MSNGEEHPRADPPSEEVLLTSGDVTSIRDDPGDADAVETGRAEIAASLTTDPDVLNLAFVTADGGVQFLQIDVDELVPGGPDATGDVDVVVSAQLTALGGDVIGSGSGAATPVGTVAVAAQLNQQGDLSLSFVDGDDRLQLVETNVAQLLQSLSSPAGGPAPAADAGPSEPRT